MSTNEHEFTVNTDNVSGIKYLYGFKLNSNGLPSGATQTKALDRSDPFNLLTAFSLVWAKLNQNDLHD